MRKSGLFPVRKCLIKAIIALVFFSALAPIRAMASGVESVKQRMEASRDLARVYETTARKIEGRSGRAVPDKTLDVRGHTCGVLGELLGLGSDVTAGWTYPDPSLNSGNSHYLKLYAASLRNYVKAAEDTLKQSSFAWRYRWNLNCAGKYNSARWYAFENEVDYEVVVSDARTKLHIFGNIQAGLYDAVAKRLAIHGSISSVELSSGGGLVDEAIKIGLLLRKRELSTVVRDSCMSACTLVFIGGADRIIPAPYYDLGFHRATEKGGTVWDGDYVYDKIRNYADKMIEGGDEIVKLVRSGTGKDFHRPDAEELCDLRVATWIEDICGKPPTQGGKQIPLE